ncbi:hypothetical protein ES288_A09G116600v1 [Gossypium darwinii]|uniref:Uncharacterized protein n=1 Tax=Gossypium darwinii TaxID=34276 RepID=A0A5D2FC97_GOSDA|nr:hypothetical protein ES288_A09G116600v1 [Gossypium darwinii]
MTKGGACNKCECAGTKCENDPDPQDAILYCGLNCRPNTQSLGFQRCNFHPLGPTLGFHQHIMCLRHRRDPKPPFLVPFPCPRDPDDGTDDVIRYGCALVCVRGRGVAAETLGRTEA